MSNMEEAYWIVFKAIVDKDGRITIPLPERRAANIKASMVVQIKMRIITEPESSEKLSPTSSKED